MRDTIPEGREVSETACVLHAGGDSPTHNLIWMRRVPSRSRVQQSNPWQAIWAAMSSVFRGTITIAGRRPIRHLVAISAEVAKTRPGANLEGNRTILCDNDPTFVLYRVAQRFGLPAVPEWADWFNAELGRRGAIRPLLGPGCLPVLVSGTKKVFLTELTDVFTAMRSLLLTCQAAGRATLQVEDW